MKNYIIYYPINPLPYYPIVFMEFLPFVHLHKKKSFYMKKHLSAIIVTAILVVAVFAFSCVRKPATHKGKFSEQKGKCPTCQ